MFRSHFRIPDDLAEWVKAQAKKDHRSMNAQLVKIIEDAKEKSE